MSGSVDLSVLYVVEWRLARRREWEVLGVQWLKSPGLCVFAPLREMLGFWKVSRIRVKGRLCCEKRKERVLGGERRLQKDYEFLRAEVSLDVVFLWKSRVIIPILADDRGTSLAQSLQLGPTERIEVHEQARATGEDKCVVCWCSAAKYESTPKDWSNSSQILKNPMLSLDRLLIPHTSSL